MNSEWQDWFMPKNAMIFNHCDIGNYSSFRLFLACWSQQNLIRVMFSWNRIVLTLIASQIASWKLITYTTLSLYHFVDDKHLRTIRLLRCFSQMNWGCLSLECHERAYDEVMLNSAYSRIKKLIDLGYFSD